MSYDILYLGSQSSARQQLLEVARIPFSVLQHASDEKVERKNESCTEYVLNIARHKMASLIFPTQQEVGKERMFILTADTLIRNPKTDALYGKPRDIEHARQMLAMERQGPVEVITGCCLDKYRYRGGQWQREASEHWATNVLVEFYVDEEAVEQYFSILPMALHSSGAGIVEDFGLSFVKSIQGSYTAVTGLPLYEVRQALKKLEFVF